LPERVSRPRTDPEGLKDLKPLWTALHTHHRTVSEYPDLVDDLEASWARRLSWYRRLLADDAFYLIASGDHDQPVGYAMVAVETEPDDTFRSDSGIAELVTLVVAEGARSRGVGRALLEAVEGIVRDRGADTLKIGVMSGNARAQRFYEAHGYRVAEHVLYRRL
jgi:ribosomal protein S18 acetylase RimI-like enzyme